MWVTFIIFPFQPLNWFLKFPFSFCPSFLILFTFPFSFPFPSSTFLHGSWHLSPVQCGNTGKKPCFQKFPSVPGEAMHWASALLKISLLSGIWWLTLVQWNGFVLGVGSTSGLPGRCILQSVSPSSKFSNYRSWRWSSPLMWLFCCCKRIQFAWDIECR